MRILFLTDSPAHYMPPQLGTTQIVAGSGRPDSRSPKGGWISIKIPVGDYIILTLQDRKPADQQPDAVVSLVDLSWRSQPRNLSCYPTTIANPDLEVRAGKLRVASNDLGCEPPEQVLYLRANLRIQS
jgi:hypothetical protein